MRPKRWCRGRRRAATRPRPRGRRSMTRHECSRSRSPRVACGGESVDQPTTAFKITPPAEADEQQDQEQGRGRDRRPGRGRARGAGRGREPGQGQGRTTRARLREGRRQARHRRQEQRRGRGRGGRRERRQRPGTRAATKDGDKSGDAGKDADGEGRRRCGAGSRAHQSVRGAEVDGRRCGGEVAGQDGGPYAPPAPARPPRAPDKSAGKAAARGRGPRPPPSPQARRARPPPDPRPPTGASAAAGEHPRGEPAPPRAAGRGRPRRARALPESERTRQEPLPPLDLLAKLTNTPPPPETPLRTVVRRFKIWTPLVMLLAIIFVVAQSVRPLPAPALAVGSSTAFTFEGGKLPCRGPTRGSRRRRSSASAAWVRRARRSRYRPRASPR